MYLSATENMSPLLSEIFVASCFIVRVADGPLPPLEENKINQSLTFGYADDYQFPSTNSTPLQVDLNALQWDAENGKTLHNKFQLFSFKKSAQLCRNIQITNATF